MNSIPSWFRWLIIVLATLILCACRSPYQPIVNTPSATPPLRQLVASSTLQSQSEPEQAEQASATSQPILGDADQLRRSTRGGVTPTRALVTPEPTALPSVIAQTHQAPIVRLRDRQQGERSIPQTATAQAAAPAQAPVYYHVDDQVVTAQQIQVAAPAVDAQVRSPELESPFGDDPVQPSEGGPESTVDPNFEPPTTMVPPLPQSRSGTVGHAEVILENATEIIIGPAIPVDLIYPMVDYSESIPMAPTICEVPQPLAAPFDYLPQAEIPVMVAPEFWALPPSETMEVSYHEMSKRYPDEYVCDGGDSQGEVSVRADWTINNLDPEDTIGHYDTLDHRVEVAPSNRVCIYAPRFAAVRKVSSPFQNNKYDRALIEQRDDHAITGQHDITSVRYDQNESVQQNRVFQPAAGLQREMPSVTGIYTLPVREMNRDFSAHEDFRVMKLGIHKQAEKPLLTEYTQNAVTWSSDKAVQVVVDGDVAHANTGVQGIESVFAIGDNRPAKLRVIKTASVSDALPGEEVEFTLRFDNIGHQPMGNVTIVDNLTTRLEYLQDTELCSLKNEFVANENDVHSLTLRWEITDPILPGQGGLIRFKCRVR